jgi:hypothetical protein
MKKRIIWVLLLAALAFQPSVYSKETAKISAVQEFAPNEADLQEHGSYINKKGKKIHSPAHSKSGAIPHGATAQCGDGSYSFSQSRRGTCSHHGGVSHWL